MEDLQVQVIILTSEETDFLKTAMKAYIEGLDPKANQMELAQAKQCRTGVLKAFKLQQSPGAIAAIIGKKGGTSTSEAKRAAVRENGKKGGRPRKQK